MAAPGTAPRGIHHFGITVADIDRSVAFYRDVLGLELVQPATEWFEGEELGRGIGLPAAKLRIAILQAGGSSVELLEHVPVLGSEPPPPNALGASHLALHVDDIDAWVERLEGLGIELFSAVNRIDEGPLAGWRWVFCADPDGYLVELVEVRDSADV